MFFLYSSSSSEASYAHDYLSFFTESIIRSIIDHKSDRIKYANILNYTSDFFEALDFQRPYVVQQGSVNGVFCSSDEGAKSRLVPFLRSSQIASTASDKNPEFKSRVDIIKEDSSKYCTKEEAESAILHCGFFLENMVLKGDLKEIYSLDFKEISNESLPPSADIGVYLNKIGGKNYFAKAIYREVEQNSYQKRISSLGLAGLALSQPERVVSGFEHTTKLTIPCYKMSALSAYAAVNQIRLYVAPIVSRINIMLAYRIYQYEQSDWGRIKTTGATEWRFEEATVKQEDQINAALERIQLSFSEYIESYISTRFNNG